MGFRGSPTILVDGVDVFAEPDAAVGLSCRRFAHAGRLRVRADDRAAARGAGLTRPLTRIHVQPPGTTGGERPVETEEELHAGCRVPGSLRGGGAGGGRPESGRPRRRDRADHHHRDLRVGPAHVRGPDRRRARHHLRPREHGRDRGGRLRRHQPEQGRPRRDALQRRLRVLHELPSRQERLLPHGEPARRRWCVRLRRDGALPRRPGGVPARPLRRLQLRPPARGRRARERLRAAGRHLPDRVPRHRAGGRASRGDRRGVRRRAGWPDGGVLRRAQGREPGLRRRQGGQPPRPGRADRRRADRLHRRRPGRADRRGHEIVGGGPRHRRRRVPGHRLRAARSSRPRC